MRHVQQVLRCAGVMVAMVVLSGCTYEAAVQQLPPPERTAFRTYRRVMTGGQVRNYLAKQTPAERSAYLAAIGVTQRFQALEPQDREAVLANQPPAKGMSADALRFLWGQPAYTKGHIGHYEYWYYLGPFMELARYGNMYSKAGVQVEVYVVAGRVDSWLEFAPDVDTDSSSGCPEC